MYFRSKAKYHNKKNQKACVRFTLCHGDMVVMHGTEIHKFYEVSGQRSHDSHLTDNRNSTK
jgi:alkylated DNA repair dioxygenase AlkB